MFLSDAAAAAVIGQALASDAAEPAVLGRLRAGEPAPAVLKLAP
jgi:4-hydroxy-4-methyl-2-oxoglutarate aldolase